jgi:hypothetical protein
LRWTRHGTRFRSRLFDDPAFARTSDGRLGSARFLVLVASGFNRVRDRTAHCRLLRLRHLLVALRLSSAFVSLRLFSPLIPLLHGLIVPLWRTRHIVPGGSGIRSRRFAFRTSANVRARVVTRTSLSLRPTAVVFLFRLGWRHRHSAIHPDV